MLNCRQSVISRGERGPPRNLKFFSVIFWESDLGILVSGASVFSLRPHLPTLSTTLTGPHGCLGRWRALLYSNKMGHGNRKRASPELENQWNPEAEPSARRFPFFRKMFSRLPQQRHQRSLSHAGGQGHTTGTMLELVCISSIGWEGRSHDG